MQSVCTIFTMRGLKVVSLCLTPADGVDVRGAGSAPVVVGIGPSVKVDQQFPITHFSDSGHAHYCRILPILGF